MNQFDITQTNRAVERLITPPPAAGGTVRYAGGYSVPNVKFRRDPEIHGSLTLLYGVGKPLVERGLAPRSLDRTAARESDTKGGVGPVAFALRLLNAIDRQNDRPKVARQTSFVNLIVKARKPG